MCNDDSDSCGLCVHFTLHSLYQSLRCHIEGLCVKRETWNGMERGMEYGMERGTDVKCPNKCVNYLRWALIGVGVSEPALAV